MARMVLFCIYSLWKYPNRKFWSPDKVIRHNFFISMIELTCDILFIYLGYKIYPLKILRATFYILIVFFCFSPVIMQNLTPSYIMLIQVYFLVFTPSCCPAGAIFYKHFLTFKRFTHTSFIFVISRAVMNIITSFGFVYLTAKLTLCLI